IFVSIIRVHPLIVTLATLSAYRGIAEGISFGRSIGNYPDAFLRLSGSIAGVPIPAILFVLFSLIVFVLLAKTPFGRSLYAIGYNETAVLFSGINVSRIKLLLYTFSGLMASIAAILFVARRNT